MLPHAIDRGDLRTLGWNRNLVNRASGGRRGIQSLRSGAAPGSLPDLPPAPGRGSRPSQSAPGFLDALPLRRRFRCAPGAGSLHLGQGRHGRPSGRRRRNGRGSGSAPHHDRPPAPHAAARAGEPRLHAASRRAPGAPDPRHRPLPARQPQGTARVRSGARVLGAAADDRDRRAARGAPRGPGVVQGEVHRGRAVRSDAGRPHPLRRGHGTGARAGDATSRRCSRSAGASRATTC